LRFKVRYTGGGAMRPLGLAPGDDRTLAACGLAPPRSCRLTAGLASALHASRPARRAKRLYNRSICRDGNCVAGHNRVGWAGMPV